MAILKFSARAVASRIAHAKSCESFLHRWDGPVDTPGLILVVGHGVHLMSNGIDDRTTRLMDENVQSPNLAYATGMNPFIDVDWMATRRAAFRDMSGRYHLECLDDIQAMLDRGHDTIRLSTDGHSVHVFAGQKSDYVLGGLYKVPSGLGGVFYVELRDIYDTFALVQNTGNCEDFDDMQPYRVSLDDLQELDTRRVA